MTSLHSLPGILVALDGARPDDVPAAVVNYLDQQGARASDELSEYFGIDLADVETARVVGATVIYLRNRGRELAGIDTPATPRDAIYTEIGIRQAMQGICGQIHEKHGRSKGAGA